jgi:hypothetical protein
MTKHEKKLAMIRCESAGVSAIIRLLMSFRMSEYPALICRLMRNVAIETSHAMYQMKMRQIAMCMTGGFGPGAGVGLPNGTPVMVNFDGPVVSRETLEESIRRAQRREDMN